MKCHLEIENDTAAVCWPASLNEALDRADIAISREKHEPPASHLQARRANRCWLSITMHVRRGSITMPATYNLHDILLMLMLSRSKQLLPGLMKSRRGHMALASSRQ